MKSGSRKHVSSKFALFIITNLLNWLYDYTVPKTFRYNRVLLYNQATVTTICSNFMLTGFDRDESNIYLPTEQNLKLPGIWFSKNLVPKLILVSMGVHRYLHYLSIICR